ncbi:MAG: SDR family NAD(P)-dependent oxidoreductase [Proteobacteria bacterium]|nr:SDR family NAD(P)-dependent oxidoreductase [Pseudomonadota bacterium]
MPRFYRNRVVVILCDALLVTLAFVFSYALRFNFDVPEFYRDQILRTLPILVPLTIAVFFFFDLYKGMWRYTGVRDLRAIILAVTVSTILTIVGLTFGYRFAGYPRSVFAINWFVLIVFIGGLRFQIRLVKEIGNPFVWRLKQGGVVNRKVMIIGAGDAGEMILREILHNPRLGYEPVCFVDDDPEKLKRKIHGVPVRGSKKDISRLTEEYGIDEVVIAIPSATGPQIRHIVDHCEKARVRFRTLPSVGELINGSVRVSQIRDVKIEDILGRDSIRLDLTPARNEISGKTVLVTGAAGSIGSELVRQIAQLAPSQIVLYERDENGLFHIYGEVVQKFPEKMFDPVVGDILDEKRMEAVMRTAKPDLVFHAAAYKHVPMMEANPAEAVKNNLLGTMRVAEEAIRSGVKKFMLISTDKAVNPVNVMGATKRAAEKGMLNLNSSDTLFMVVRFGNVLGSRGSVVPIFEKQIAAGGPVKVTHQEMTRYFMTIGEAAQLVILAASIGRGGEIFVLDMGEPVRIMDLARNMITLSGFEPDKDIEIEVIGKRPGEKLHEVLVSDQERIVGREFEKIMKIGHGDDDQSILQRLGQLEDLARQGNDRLILEAVKDIVPEFMPIEHQNQDSGNDRILEEPRG